MTRQRTGSLAALQQRKLPHVPGMRYPHLFQKLIREHEGEPVKNLDRCSDARKMTHRVTHTSVHTHTDANSGEVVSY